MAGRGKPRAFKDAKAFEDKFIEYIEYCRENKRFSNIAGFCAYCHITRDTFYAQKEYYSDTYNIVNDILEDEVLQDNTYRAQLYLKNKFGYTDKQSVESKNTNTNINTDITDLPPEALEEIAKAQGQEEVMRIVGKYRK
jgi:hypothetical protein